MTSSRLVVALFFARFAASYEIARKQNQSPRLRQLNDANKGLLAGESFVALIGADQMAARLVADASGDLCRGHAGLAEAVDSFHASERNTSLRLPQRSVTAESAMYVTPRYALHLIP